MMEDESSGKRPVRLWASLASFQRRKDAKDAKMSRLWKVGYLVSERHHASLKDAEHLSKPCLGLSKECLCIGLHLSDLLSYVFGIFQKSAAPFCRK